MLAMNRRGNNEDIDGADSNQVLYNLQERAIDHAVLRRCEKYGVAVTA